MKETKSSNARLQPVEDSSDFLGDQVIAQAVSEDPLFRFLKVYWRQVMVVVAALLAGYFGNQFFQQAYTESMKRSGDLLAGVHQQMAVLNSVKRDLEQSEKDSVVVLADVKKTAEEKESATKKVSELKDKNQQGQERLRELLLALSDSRRPYDSIARIYQGIMSAQAGDIESARKSLEGFNWQGLKADSQERFFAETAALAMAGALLDNDATYPEARNLLKSLAGQGEFLNIAAAVRLSRVSILADERSETAALIEELRGRYPEQAALLESEIQRLRH